MSSSQEMEQQAEQADQELGGSSWVNTRGRPWIIAGLILALVILVIWMPNQARQELLQGLLAQRLLLFLLFAFALLTLSLLWTAGQKMDTWIFLGFNLHGYHAPWLDRMMWVFTQLGSAPGILAACGLSYTLGFRRLMVELILGTLTLWLLVETIKAIADRARPYLMIPEARVVGWKARGRSFPSGHTSQAFFLLAFLVGHFHLSLAAGLGLYLVAALIGFTRIYIGAHYPRDVLGGAVLGVVWSVLLLLVEPYFSPRFF